MRSILLTHFAKPVPSVEQPPQGRQLLFRKVGNNSGLCRGGGYYSAGLEIIYLADFVFHMNQQNIMDSARQKKSCRECAKAKRRCSLGTPCQRCARQGRDCRKRNETGDQPEGQYAPDHPDLTMPLLLQNDADADFLNFNTDLVDGIMTNFGIEESLDLAPLPAASSVCGPRFSTSVLKSFQTARLEYPIQVLKAVPASFVHGNQTPWSHPLLWEDEMPRCLQGMWCRSALARNMPRLAGVEAHVPRFQCS